MPPFVGHGLLLNRQFSGKNGTFRVVSPITRLVESSNLFLRKNSHEQKFFSTNKINLEKKPRASHIFLDFQWFLVQVLSLLLLCCLKYEQCVFHTKVHTWKVKAENDVNGNEKHVLQCLQNSQNVSYQKRSACFRPIWNTLCVHLFGQFCSNWAIDYLWNRCASTICGIVLHSPLLKLSKKCRKSGDSFKAKKIALKRRNL